MFQVAAAVSRCLLLVLGTMLWAPSVPAAEQKQVYTLGVLPSAPPIATHTRWMPLVERLSRETGVTFQLKVYEKMSEFEQDIWHGGPDFIFASPVQAVVAHRRIGYAPLVRGGDPVTIRLFVRAGSPITTLDDLAGKRIAFVGNKNMCSVFVRHMLAKERDRLTYLEEFTGSTKNVIKSVLIGKSDAGVLFASDIEQESGDVRGQTRTLSDSSKLAPHPLCVHPRVPQKTQDRLLQAVLGIAASADGRDLLKKVKLAKPVAADYARDYRALDEIDVIGLTNWGQ